MLFKKFNFDDPEAVNSFKFKIKHHEGTWAEYYKAYAYAIKTIIEKGLQNNYELNSRAFGLMFLIRHSIELCLKLNLPIISGEQRTSHDLEDLIKSFPDNTLIPKNLLNIIDIINYDSDGSCFRYPLHKYTKKPYFTITDRLNFGEVLQLHYNIECTSDFQVEKISNFHNFNDRIIEWDLTFHFGEANEIDLIRTQFDECTEFLIEEILSGKCDIDKTYIPLLFLIRHSLELALRSNIEEIQKTSKLIKHKDYSGVHSLSKLFNCYNKFLNQINLDRVDSDFRSRLNYYRSEYSNLNETLHILDKNSQYLRFPIDRHGNLHTISLGKIDFIKILKLYYDIDPFLTVTNNVLEEAGFITLADEDEVL